MRLRSFQYESHGGIFQSGERIGKFRQFGIERQLRIGQWFGEQQLGVEWELRLRQQRFQRLREFRLGKQCGIERQFGDERKLRVRQFGIGRRQRDKRRRGNDNLGCSDKVRELEELWPGGS